jgi:hypothetical protein
MVYRDGVEKKRGSRITIIILVILLLVAVGYIAYGKIIQMQNKKQLTVYQQGAQLGFEQAIIQVAQQASTCQPVPLMVSNQTINVIAIECLQQPQQTPSEEVIAQ